MKTLLRHKKPRKTFLIIVGLILLLTLLLRFLYLPMFTGANTNQEPVNISQIWPTIFAQLLDGIFVSLTVTVAIGLFLFYIELPDEEKKFEIIEPFKIGEFFKKERGETDIWYFSGGTGRFTRSTTIPELAKIARNNNQHITIKIQIIDPTNKDACDAYAFYRKGLKSSANQQGKWTTEYVRQEIAATILSATIFQSNCPLLDISICLKNNFSTLRIDLSSNIAIVTKEDPQEAALICREGSFLYRTYKEEILQTFKEYKKLDIAQNASYTLHQINKDLVETLVNNLAINNAFNLEDYEKISNILKENINPYAA